MTVCGNGSRLSIGCRHATSPGMTDRQNLHPGLKLVLDLGPLAAFGLAYWRYGIFVGTATLMVAMLPALPIYYALTRRLPVMPIVTAILVLVLGTLTLVLQNETFIKITQTIIHF